MFGRTGTNDIGALPFRQLNSQGPYSSSCAMDQHFLPKGQIAKVKQRLPGGQPCKRDSGSFIKIKHLGHQSEAGALHSYKFRSGPIAEKIGKSVYAVALFQGARRMWR